MATDYNEADTCRVYVTPALRHAGWDVLPHAITEQRTFTDGRIVVSARKTRRGSQKIADYILRYRGDFPIAVVEAKRVGLPAAEGLQQAMDYAQILDLKFAYATNGQEIIEHDFLTGHERHLNTFPTPDELWMRLADATSITPVQAAHLLEPMRREQGKQLRYYQDIAVHRAVQAIASGQRRVLLTMATGTGKTFVAFQICWKLWHSRWNQAGEHRKPRILFLADRNILIDDPKDKTFAPFEDARFKIENGTISRGREMYFAIYQALVGSDDRPPLYREFPPDFFDLIVVDECHRGSAREDSNWREILEYFSPAYQLGMTATPRRADNVDTYQYFGNPIYQYSLKQGIEDGFLFADGVAARIKAELLTEFNLHTTVRLPNGVFAPSTIHKSFTCILPCLSKQRATPQPGLHLMLKLSRRCNLPFQPSAYLIRDGCCSQSSLLR